MRRGQPGCGELEVELVAGQTAVTRARATNPLKLLTPRPRGPAVWVYTTTYGGGMVAGDQIDLSIRVGRGATCMMATQSTTKVYRSPKGRTCRLLLEAKVDQGATLLVAPDPVTCFADALYEQTQCFDVHADGALVLVDWLTSGRRQRGERWAFTRFRSRLDIRFCGQHVLADALLLDPQHGPLQAPHRLGRFNCLAALVLLGERLSEVCGHLLRQVAQQPVQRRASILHFASPLRGGAVFRALGSTPEQVGQWLHEKLGFVEGVLGDTPWTRKW